MGETFKAIETQEELDKVISARLDRERKKYEGYLSPEDVAKKYEGYLSPEDVNKKYEGYLSPEDAADLNKKIKGYEANSVKTRIAHENGLPYDAVAFLQGDDEESIRKSAKTLKSIMGKGTPPLASREQNENDKKTAAYKRMLSEMKGK